jgi:hypothetical protein
VSATVRHPELAALQIADPPGAWQALGFTVSDGIVVLGSSRPAMPRRA